MSSSIGYFQFDNLVRGRVGFVFVNLGVDTNAVYPHIYKMHLESRLLPLPEGDLATATTEQILAAMKVHPKESAVILLCQDGQRSESLAALLEAEGYINTFFVRGGWNQVLLEREKA